MGSQVDWYLSQSDDDHGEWCGRCDGFRPFGGECDCAPLGALVEQMKFACWLADRGKSNGNI